MKNRIIILASLVSFIIFAIIYTNGNFQSQDEEWNMGPGSGTNSAITSNEIESPTADNVATSYYEKVSQLEEYLAANPTDTTHILRLARLYQEGHQPEKASGWYEEYLELRPDDIQSMLDLANTYGESGEWGKALGITDKLLEMDPENGKALYNKAAIQANQGNLDEATEIWELIVEKQLDDEIVLLSKSALEKLSKM